MSKEKTLNFFLKYGYFPGYQNKEFTITLDGVNPAKQIGVPEDELQRIATKKWKSSFAKSYQSNCNNVVPISGGMDSRTLLAELLEHEAAKNIKTYTFGTPGALDYELGNLVAREAGTNHTSFDLSKYEYKLEELLDISVRSDHQSLLFHHPPIWQLDQLYSDGVFWTGYLGDGVTTDLLHQNAKDIEAQKLIYLQQNRFVNSIELTNCEISEYMDLIEYMEDNQEILSFERQLFFQEREQKQCAPHVLIKGFNYKNPFVNNEFMKFMLSIPDCYRHDQYLHRKMLLTEYPKISSLPTTRKLGLSIKASPILFFGKRIERQVQKYLQKYKIRRAKKYVNYIDFDQAIRNRADLNQLVYSSIQDLKARKLINWLDFDSIWSRHINKKSDHSDALLVLASLEIHLKAGKKL